VASRRIEVEVDDGLLMRADRDAMKHVFFNLLLNALEATPAGGQVTCRAEQGKRQLTIMVEDRGDGLGATPEECLQPFFTTKKNGSGLGLAVCAKALRSHGGLVEMRDRDGGGCRVSVVLPRVDEGDEGRA
jgi:signal transduction histidine kinase